MLRLVRIKLLLLRRVNCRNGGDFVSNCNHKINDNDTTIRIDFKNTSMVYPRVYFGSCVDCGKTFTFNKVDGDYVEVK